MEFWSASAECENDFRKLQKFRSTSIPVASTFPSRPSRICESRGVTRPANSRLSISQLRINPTKPDMKKNPSPDSGVLNLRGFLALLLCSVGLLIAMVGFASTPSSGTLTDSSAAVTWTGGPFVVPNASAQAGSGPVCTGSGQDCDDFTLHVNVTTDATKKVRVEVGWPVTTADFDVYIYKTDGTTLVTSSASSADPEVCFLDAKPGDYIVRIVPFAPAGQSYTATASLSAPPVAPPAGSGPAPRYKNYPAPLDLPGAGSAGEPSIGVDWNPNVAGLSHDTVNTGGVAFFTANLNEYRVSFDDCPSPAKALWEDVTNATEGATTLDPIGFVDRLLPNVTPAVKSPGRVFQSQLAGASSITSFSDDDGNTWMQSQGSGQPAGVDHQTLGGGPYAPTDSSAVPPVVEPPHPLYANQIYYASQDIATAFAARSDDGGQTFGPGVPIYNLSQCGGLHGHLKVGPDGTAYVPNRGCGANQAVAVSRDNGVTWTVKPIPQSAAGETDPSVGIATDNTVYFGYQNADGHPHIAVSKDHGDHWSDVDVSQNTIQNCVFPEVVAGDGDRAAFGFLGTSTGGNYQDTANFKGVWFFYIATTLDGGKTYTLVDGTNGDPVQVGSICTGGTTCGSDRNLLDFNDITIDKQGRVLAAYADGCVSPGCAAATATTTTPPYSASRSALSSIIRQSGGPRLLHQFDPPEPTVPAAPQLTTAAVTSAGVQLSWQEPDNGGSPITGYKIYRGTASGAETFLASTGPKTTFTDTTATDPNAKYFYKVTAVNTVGEGASCGEIAAVAPVGLPSPCSLPGVPSVNDVNADGSDNDTAPNLPPDPSVNIKRLFVAEPFLGAGVNTLVFTLQVAPSANAAPVSSQWYIIWNKLTPTADFDRNFVAMKTDVTGAISFQYGDFGVALDPTNPNPNANTPVTKGAADAGSYDPATGTITISLSNNKVEGIHAGQTLGGLNVRTYLARPDAGQKSQNNASDITGDGSFTLQGNAICVPNTPPVAALTASPTDGDLPLTVSFDASGSTDADTGDTIASYTFNFGDGSEPVTQTSPKVDHTYTTRGVFRATVSVTDSRGALSNNLAGLEIEIDAALQNISTRERVLTGDNVLIAGFIITGPDPKKIIIGAIGPSIKDANGQANPATLQDPILELHDTNSIIAFNDNWKDSQQADIQATGLAPTDDREAAIVTTLAPGTYTAIVRGKNDTTGIALVELFDIDANFLVATTSVRTPIPKQSRARSCGPAPAGLSDRACDGAGP